MKKLSQDEFIERARKVHTVKYDYSKVEYNGNRNKVCIICPIHGEFYQTPRNHLQGQGCPLCRYDKVADKCRKTKEEFIIDAQRIHGDKYDYSEVKYINAHSKVSIICPIHGKFIMKPNKHLIGQGCPSCKIGKISKSNTKSQEQFIHDAKKIHGDKYDYSKVEYINTDTKVCIICSTHGEFWQRPADHLKGCGCQKCKQSSLEREILNFLSENEINYEYNLFPKFLNGLQLDFYIPEYNVGIECQGEQHFKPIDIFGGKSNFNKTKERDERKRKLCEENGIKLLYYSNLDVEYPYEVITDKNNLLNIIKSYEK